ncbi:TrmB family transcriptional regulator [Priestia megaterium]|nr:TrmB family transcriptional regulator [Priestia megaterium]
MEQLIEQFENLGFSKNEAKVYMALLQEPAITGYEVSKKSGVPRSMVYAVIGKLVAKQAIMELRTETPTYTPVPVKELIANQRKQAEETLSILEKGLESIEKPVEVNVIKHIESREQVLQAMQKLIQTSSEEVWLSAWEQELDELCDSAEKQIENGINMYSLLFSSQESNSFGKTFYHSPSTASIEKGRLNQRLTILIQDNSEVLIAGFVDGQVPQAIQTTEPMLILLAKEYIRHDMMMKVVSEKMGEEELDSMWRSDDLLRYIVSNVKG